MSEPPAEPSAPRGTAPDGVSDRDAPASDLPGSHVGGPHVGGPYVPARDVAGRDSESKVRFDGREAATSMALVLGVAVAGLLAWELIVWMFELPKALLPTPRQCVAAAIENRQSLVRGTMSTGIAAFVGLLVAVALGVLIAIAFSLSRKLRLAFFPYMILLQTVPIVAIAPLLIIWSGYTFRTVVIVTVIVCLFPIVNNATAGLMAIDRDMSDLFQMYGAGRGKRLRKLQVPSAIGHLMLGVKTSSGLAVIGAIVAEFFVGNGTSYDGLGTLMTGWQALTKTDALIAALFASAVLGLVMFAAVQWIASGPLARWTRSDV